MAAVLTDIDIDFADRNKALEDLIHVCAVQEHKGVTSRHPSGVYFQNIPIHPVTNHASLPYDRAGEYGYFKVDFLNNTIYEGVRDEDHLNQLIAEEPEWSLLEHRDFVEQIDHIRDHFGVVQFIKPQSVEDLAVVLALIRPGKRHLMWKSRDQIDAEIWSQTPGDEYTFKRAHGIAYALSLVVKMNLIFEQAHDKLVAEAAEQ